jgi:hypothetical protein
MDEHFVRSQQTFFGPDPQRDQAKERARARIVNAVDAASEDEVLEAEAETWAAGLAEEHALEVPTVDVSVPDVREHKAVDIDCTGAPGITYSLSEAAVIRPGHQMSLSVPYTGNADLLRTYTPSIGMLRIKVDIENGQIVRKWEWPDVKGAEAFNAEVEEYLRELDRGTKAVAEDIDEFNASLRGFALERINERKRTVEAGREFLGGITLPVKRDQDAPQDFEAPPVREQFRERPNPAKKAEGRPPEDPVRSEDLDEFYEHILEIIRAVGRGLERSPGSFADAAEPVLRDHMLVTLNTHYISATYAEAFNREGKTDILIRIFNENAFIGECKWWEGPKALEEALGQLFGYTTWRDSRVALIFYVQAKEVTDIVVKAKETLEARDEFIEWNGKEREGELRCRVKWPEDEKRVATLTALFFHIPKGS